MQEWLKANKWMVQNLNNSNNYNWWKVLDFNDVKNNFLIYFF